MHARIMGGLSAVLILLACWGSVSCSGDVKSLEDRESRHPVFRRAMAKKNGGDYEGAIKLFDKLLERKPRHGLAHLHQGLLCDSDEIQDYVRAIYHYRKYLEIRPNAEKKQMILEIIQEAETSFAVSLPDPPSGAAREIGLLKKQISSLEAQLERTRARSFKPGRTVDGSGKTLAVKPRAKPSSVGPVPAPAQPAVQTYVLRPGDTLSRVAGRMYNDPTKWRLIFEANKELLQLKRPEEIRVGQTLIIPIL